MLVFWCRDALILPSSLQSCCGPAPCSRGVQAHPIVPLAWGEAQGSWLSPSKGAVSQQGKCLSRQEWWQCPAVPVDKPGTALASLPTSEDQGFKRATNLNSLGDAGHLGCRSNELR